MMKIVVICLLCLDKMSQGTMQPITSDGSIFRIKQLQGYSERRNDVLYAPSLKNNQSDSFVVFFGGDIQDFEENMENNSDDAEYIRWSLENVARILRNKFPYASIVVVRPSRYDRGTFSCYNNFVPTGKYGVPLFVDYNYALVHLEQLLRRFSTSAAEIPNVTKIHSSNVESVTNQVKTELRTVDFEKAKVILIGFSKGCVVLNQFVHEMHHLRGKKALSSKGRCEIISRITDMYFMDGGHAGDKNAWVTDPRLLHNLSISGIHIHVHVTPYQVNDPMRPWIGEEEKIFVDTLRTFQTNVRRVLHFPEEVGSLNNHFEILELFT